MTEPTHTIEYVNFNAAADGSVQTAHMGQGEGANQITAISQHDPRGPGDMWYYDVIRRDGSFLRIFNPCQVGYSKPMNVTIPKKQLIV